MNEKEICKYCKAMNVTIVPPSTKQYCTIHHRQVDLHDCCEWYSYDKEAEEQYKQYGDIE